MKQTTITRWSLVITGATDSYAASIRTFSSKEEALKNQRPEEHLVYGTQMWNEPLGQIEERPTGY